MAKIGYLYLRNGAWEGQQLVPSAWIDKIVHGTVNAGMGFRYSNLFWELPHEHGYFASGRYGQSIIVLPDLDIVAVTTGRVFFSMNEFTELISGSVIQWLGIRGVDAVKGAWMDDHTFLINLLLLGQGPANMWTLTFKGDNLSLRVKFDDGPEKTADGKTGG